MTAEPAASSAQTRPLVAVLVALFKLRIVALLLLAALAGAFLASGGRPAGSDVLVLLLAGTASAAGASALNEYFERDRDALMRRTAQRRPLASRTSSCWQSCWPRASPRRRGSPGHGEGNRCERRANIPRHERPR